MRNKLLKITYIFCCIAYLLSLGYVCYAKDKVEVWITDHFEKDSAIVNKYDFENKSAVEVTKKTAEVKTSFGGGFVYCINDIKSRSRFGQRADWFFYLNGIMSEKGAGSVIPLEGDIVWWDFHNWSDSNYCDALIGGFPQPFLNQSKRNATPVNIFYSKDLFSIAGEISKIFYINGIKNINSEEFKKREQIKLKGENYFYILDIEDLTDNKFIRASLQNNHFYKRYEKLAQGMENGGGVDFSIIAAIKLGSVNTLWLLTGTNEDAIKRALELLKNNPEKIRYQPAVILKEGKVINLYE